MPTILNVEVDETTLHVFLADGREISAPLEWFPRLIAATLEQEFTRHSLISFL